MSDRLRILHLGSDEHECQSLRTQLEKYGLDCAVERINSRVEFETAHDAGRPDLILANLGAGWLEGRDTLEFAKARSPDVPVIFISEPVNEETLVELIRSGAADFIRKDRPELLAPAIQRALGQGQERRQRAGSTESLRRRNEDLENLVRESTAQMAESAVKVRELAAQFAHARQQERERLAHLLHENLQQLLVAARMHAGILRDEPDLESTRRGIAKVEDLLCQAIEASRAFDRELRQPTGADCRVPAGDNGPPPT